MLCFTESVQALVKLSRSSFTFSISKKNLFEINLFLSLVAIKPMRLEEMKQL